MPKADPETGSTPSPAPKPKAKPRPKSAPRSPPPPPPPITELGADDGKRRPSLWLRLLIWLGQTAVAFILLVLLDLAGIDIFDMKERAASSAAGLLRMTVPAVIYSFSALPIVVGLALRFWGFLVKEGADVPLVERRPGALGFLWWLLAIMRDGWVHRPRQMTGELFVVLGTVLILAGLVDTFRKPIRFATTSFEAVSAADEAIKLKVDRRERFKLRSENAGDQCFVTFADNQEVPEITDRSRNGQRVIVPCGCLAKDKPLVLGAILRGDSSAGDVRMTPSMSSEIVRGFPSTRVLIGSVVRDGERWLEVRGGPCNVGYVRVRQRAMPLRTGPIARPPISEMGDEDVHSSTEPAPVQGFLRLDDNGAFWVDETRIELALGLSVGAASAERRAIVQAYLTARVSEELDVTCDRDGQAYRCRDTRERLNINTTIEGYLSGRLSPPANWRESTPGPEPAPADAEAVL